MISILFGKKAESSQNFDEKTINSRIKSIEDTLIYLGSEIGALKSSIARLNAATAVKAREEKKKESHFEDITPDDLLKAIIKGEPITSVDLSGVPSSSINSSKDRSADNK